MICALRIRVTPYLTRSAHSDKITTMDTELKHIKITADTHKKLKILAALMGKTMMEILEQLVSEALKKAKENVDSESL